MTFVNCNLNSPLPELKAASVGSGVKTAPLPTSVPPDPAARVMTSSAPAVPVLIIVKSMLSPTAQPSLPATAKAAVYLEQLPADDPIRPQLRAYFLALKELDKITYEVLDPKATMGDLLSTVSKLEKEQDTDVKAKYELDVALMQGKAEQKIEFEHELAEVNKSKGQVAANIWKEINALLGDPQYEDAKISRYYLRKIGVLIQRSLVIIN